jgi:hypothetical protein
MTRGKRPTEILLYLDKMLPELEARERAGGPLLRARHARGLLDWSYLAVYEEPP